MSYASITTLLHDPSATMNTLEYAIQAARNWDAHLHIVCAGIDSTDPGFYYAGASAVAVQQNLELAQADASELNTLVKARLKKEDIKWDMETVTMTVNGVEPFLADHMRYSDIAILPLPYGETRSSVDVAVFEACLFGSDIPVLAVPEGMELKGPIARVLLAWDDGAEALAAARAAIPLIKTVPVTEICVINPSRTGSDRSDPGGRLAHMLSRVGAQAEITVSAQLRTDIADQLLQRATETGAELIVMGAYGHSRFREAILGGVTRSMLRKAKVPVLMAH